jgi:hypothetical protein
MDGREVQVHFPVASFDWLIDWRYCRLIDWLICLVYQVFLWLSDLFLLQTTFTLEGNVLKQAQHDTKGGFDSFSDREFNGNELITVSTASHFPGAGSSWSGDCFFSRLCVVKMPLLSESTKKNENCVAKCFFESSLITCVDAIPVAASRLSSYYWFTVFYVDLFV